MLLERHRESFAFLYRHDFLSVVSREQSEKTKRLKTGGSDARVYCFSFYGGYTTLIVTSGHQPSWCPTLLCTFKNKQTHTHTQTDKSQTHGGLQHVGGNCGHETHKVLTLFKDPQCFTLQMFGSPVILTPNRSGFSFGDVVVSRWTEELFYFRSTDIRQYSALFRFSEFVFFGVQLLIKYIYLKMQCLGSDQLVCPSTVTSVFTQCADNNDILKVTWHK